MNTDNDLSKHAVKDTRLLSEHKVDAKPVRINERVNLLDTAFGKKVAKNKRQHILDAKRKKLNKIEKKLAKCPLSLENTNIKAIYKKKLKQSVLPSIRAKKQVLNLVERMIALEDPNKTVDTTDTEIKETLQDEVENGETKRKNQKRCSTAPGVRNGRYAKRLRMEKANRMIQSSKSSKSVLLKKDSHFGQKQIRQWKNELKYDLDNIYGELESEKNTNYEELLAQYKSPKKARLKMAEQNLSRKKDIEKKEIESEKNLLHDVKETVDILNSETTANVEPDFYHIERHESPMRMPPSLQAFWDRYSESKDDPKDLAKKKAKGKFRGRLKGDMAVTGVNIRPKSVVGISKEMEGKIIEHLDFQVGSGFWKDEVSSEIARPLSASLFCNRALQLARPGTSTRFAGNDTTLQEQIKSLGQFRYNHVAHEAVQKIQHLARHRRNVKDTASTVLSKVFRGFVIRRNFEDKRMEAYWASVMIQATFRGHMGRERVRYIIRMGHNLHAMDIQRVWRGFIGRRIAAAALARLRYNSATTIQRIVRGKFGRRKGAARRFEVHTNAAKSIQMLWKWKKFRNHFKAYHNKVYTACQNFQKVIRGVRDRKFVRRKKNAIRMQKIGRGFLAKQRWAATRAAASRIAGLFRSFKGRQIASALRETLLQKEAMRQGREDSFLDSIGDAIVEIARQGINDPELGAPFVKALKRKVAKLRKMRKKLLKLLPDGIARKAAAFESFAACDTDAGGTIDKQEFRQMLRELCITLTSAEFESSLKEIDTDGSGEIDISEFQDWYEATMTKPKGVIANLIVTALRTRKQVQELSGVTTRKVCEYFYFTYLRRASYILARRMYRSFDPPRHACCSCIASFALIDDLHMHEHVCRIKIANELNLEHNFALSKKAGRGIQSKHRHKTTIISRAKPSEGGVRGRTSFKSSFKTMTNMKRQRDRLNRKLQTVVKNTSVNPDEEKPSEDKKISGSLSDNEKQKLLEELYTKVLHDVTSSLSQFIETDTFATIFTRALDSSAKPSEVQDMDFRKKFDELSRKQIVFSVENLIHTDKNFFETSI
eukprot:g1346.t1